VAAMHAPGGRGLRLDGRLRDGDTHIVEPDLAGDKLQPQQQLDARGVGGNPRGEG